MKWSAFLRAVLRLRAQQSGVCLRQPNTPLVCAVRSASREIAASAPPSRASARTPAPADTVWCGGKPRRHPRARARLPQQAPACSLSALEEHARSRWLRAFLNISPTPASPRDAPHNARTLGTSVTREGLRSARGRDREEASFERSLQFCERRVLWRPIPPSTSPSQTPHAKSVVMWVSRGVWRAQITHRTPMRSARGPNTRASVRGHANVNVL